MTVSPVPTVGTTLTPRPATPFPRLIAAILASNVGALVALLTPLQLLLTLHLTRIAANEAEAALGVVSGFGALVGMFANPLGGRLSDRTVARFGRRRTWILSGGLIGSLILFSLTFTAEVWQVVVIWSVVCAVFNFQLAASSALMADQVPLHRRGTASGFLGLAAAVGPLIGLGAVNLVRAPMAQWAILSVVAGGLAVTSVILLRDPQHPRGDRPPFTLVELLKTFWVNPRRHPAFGWAWAVRFLLMCGHAATGYNAFFLMDRFGFTTEDVSRQVLLMSVLTVGVLAVTSVVAGPLSDRLQRQKPFVVAAGLLAAAGLICMALASDLSHVYVALTLLAIGLGLFLAIDTAMCVRVMPSAECAGKDFAIINMANTLPQSFVPFIAPFLLGLGGFNVLYGVLAVITVLGSLAVFRLPEIGREGDPRWAQITQ